MVGTELELDEGLVTSAFGKKNSPDDRTEHGYFTGGGCRPSLVSADGAMGGVLLLHSHAPSSGCDAHPRSGQCALGKEQGPPNRVSLPPLRQLPAAQGCWEERWVGRGDGGDVCCWAVRPAG